MRGSGGTYHRSGLASLGRGKARLARVVMSRVSSGRNWRSEAVKRIGRDRWRSGVIAETKSLCVVFFQVPC